MPHWYEILQIHKMYIVKIKRILFQQVEKHEIYVSNKELKFSLSVVQRYWCSNYMMVFYSSVIFQKCYFSDSKLWNNIANV